MYLYSNYYKRNCGYEHTVVSGHMAKTRRLLSENLNLVDVVIELLDAGYLQAAKSEIDKIIGNKPRLIVLNKSDLADSEISKQWQYWYKAKGVP